MNMQLQNKVSEMLLKWAKPVHKRLRGRKVDLFLRLVGKAPIRDTLLDVGGEPGIGGEFLRLYRRFSQVFVVNLDTTRVKATKACQFSAIKADGCALPFRTQSVSWVFSNAVIEHVGGWEAQVRLANEIRRVASNGYFVTTPNKFFPIEQHTFLPFYQFLPTWAQRKLVRFSPGYVRQPTEIHLLSAKQLQELFPEATIVSTGFPVLGNSLVALHRKELRPERIEKGAKCVSNLHSEAARARTFDQFGEPAPYGSYAVKKRIEKIDEALELAGRTVLDLGCGNGCYTQELARRAASVCGVDIQLFLLKTFRQSIPRVQAAGESLPFASEIFDAVTLIEVLEHTNCDTKVLSECFRVLKPGGRLVLFVPNKLYPFESHPCHVGSWQIGPNIPFVSWLPDFAHKRLCRARIYTRGKLFSMAHEAGFQDYKSGYIFPPLDSFPLPFKEAYRRASRRLERSFLARFGVSIYAIFRKAGPSSKASPLESTPMLEHSAQQVDEPAIASPDRIWTYNDPGERWR